MCSLRGVLVEYEIVVGVDIVVGIVGGGGYDEGQGVGGDVGEGSPCAGGYVEAIIGAIERECALLVAVVGDDVEASGEGYDKLAVGAVGVALAFLASGHVVDPVDALYGEGYLLKLLNHREIDDFRRFTVHHTILNT